MSSALAEITKAVSKASKEKALTLGGSSVGTRWLCIMRSGEILEIVGLFVVAILHSERLRWN